MSDEDVIAMHAFLCTVAIPFLPAAVSPKKSASEVWRVATQECALMAMRENILVGTLGLIQAPFWWAETGHFYTNRWFFALPNQGAGTLLLREAIGIAVADNMELHIIDEKKERYKIFNRHPKRDAPAPFILQPRLPREMPPHVTLQ